MYVAPEGRSRGLARALLEALEDAARDLGYARVRLDTGPRAAARPRAVPAPPATARSTNYNANPAASFWGEKDLQVSDAQATATAGARAGSSASSRGRRREMTFETPSPPIDTP